MSTVVRVGGYLLALVAVLAIATGIGRAVGPVGEAPATEHAADGHADDSGHTDQTDTKSTAQSEGVPGGLMVTQDGYALALLDESLSAGDGVEVRFSITGPDARPVTRFDVEHDKRLHLIAVRRDHTGFQHVHPRLAGDGTWTVTLDLTPGPWRLFADFKPTGAAALTLGTDLLVAGPFTPAPPAEVGRTANIDGYAVTLEGVLEPGRDSELTLTVTRNGTPVTDLEPYLGAYGHLVALREGDLAYLHVHPDGAPGDGTTRPGPDVVFYAAVPSAGRYRLYLDFKHDGVVRTAAFALATEGAAPIGASPSADHDSAHTH